MMNVITATDQDIRCETAPPSAGIEVHADYLSNFALGQLRDADAAQDLVQDTFLAALKAKSPFSGKSSHRTWLVGILRHKIYDYLRRHCRERAHRVEPTSPSSRQDSWDESLLWLHDVASECQSPSRRMELGEFRENLEKALGELPPRVAQVFQLYAIEECSNQEVCERLDISESNLWVMLHRGRNKLRELLLPWRNNNR